MVNATLFQAAVNEQFLNPVLDGSSILLDSDLKENFLTSDSITALYEALLGDGGINWSNAAHHVIVGLGSTAPRDPNYLENYCVSPAVTPLGLTNCTALDCEPSVLVKGNATPICEGWVLSSTANKSASIASLAHNAPDCVGSLGGNCTIDVIDVNDTPTNPFSPSWSAGGGSGGPVNWTEDAQAILQAGCDMASATGGSWSGPNWFTCIDLATKGTLVGVPFGGPGLPALLELLPLRRAHEGRLRPRRDSRGGAPALLPADVRVPAVGRLRARELPPVDRALRERDRGVEGMRERPDGDEPEQRADLRLELVGRPGEGPDGPRRYVGRLVLGGRLRAGVRLLPVDSCTTSACLAAGVDQVYGFTTSMTFLEYGGSNVVSLSFGLMEVTLEPAVIPGFGPPAPPVLPGPLSPSAPPPAGRRTSDALPADPRRGDQRRSGRRGVHRRRFGPRSGSVPHRSRRSRRASPAPSPRRSADASRARGSSRYSGGSDRPLRSAPKARRTQGSPWTRRDARPEPRGWAASPDDDRARTRRRPRSRAPRRTPTRPRAP